MKSSGNTILITGGGGYIGSAVAKEFLDSGAEVRVLDLFIHGKGMISSVLEHENCTVFEGDVRNEVLVKKALKNVDYVVHLAAIAGAPESERVPELSWDINLEGTKTLFNLAKRSGVKRFIFVSTCSNYGGLGSENFADETSELAPISPYAESKVAAEKFILSGAPTGSSAGDSSGPSGGPARSSSEMVWTICRLATVYGVSPRMRFDLLVNQFTRDAYYGEKIEIFGEQGRTFVHVLDVVAAFKHILGFKKSGVMRKVFNIGSTKGSNMTKRDLGFLVKKEFPKADIVLLDKVIDGRDYKVSFELVKESLGFDPKHTVQGGVKEIASYLDSNPNIDTYAPMFSNVNKYELLSLKQPISVRGLQREAACIRKDVLEVIVGAGEGHIPSSLSTVEILVVLYRNIMNIDSKTFSDPQSERDHFVLSKGHASVSYYSMLSRVGFFPREELVKYETMEGILGGHPDSGLIPGVEISTGSLGQGFPVAVGFALSAKIKDSKSMSYCIVGDGECNEGSIWEGASIAAHLKLNNLVVIIDHNKIQSSGSVLDVQNPQDLAEKWRSFGWEVREVDGHDIESLKSVFESTPFAEDKPSAIIAHTIKGKGVSFMEDVPMWHTMIPNDEEYKKAMSEIEDQIKQVEK
jgi:transketolase